MSEHASRSRSKRKHRDKTTESNLVLDTILNKLKTLEDRLGQQIETPPPRPPSSTLSAGAASVSIPEQSATPPLPTHAASPLRVLSPAPVPARGGHVAVPMPGGSSAVADATPRSEAHGEEVTERIVGTLSSLLQEHSNQMRRDGGLCFEIPPWQHQPVELDSHLSTFRRRFNESSLRRQRGDTHLALVNSQISRYMNTVLAPFLDTYLRNIQNSYQQMTTKILKKIKEEINLSVQKKNTIYKDLIELADALNVPATCDEERRQARTLASRHVSQIHQCTEAARSSIAAMGKYAEEMISITKKHMQKALEDASNVLKMSAKRSNGYQQDSDIKACLKELSRSAVALGYDLDLSLTNGRRHNEQSSERLTSCCVKVKRSTEDAVTALKDLLYQCVYA